MPSILAAAGFGKSDRDMIGRWSPEGSDDYVRSYRAVVKKMVADVVFNIRQGIAYEKLDEQCSLDDLEDAVVMKGAAKAQAEIEMKDLVELSRDWIASPNVVDKSVVKESGPAQVEAQQNNPGKVCSDLVSTVQGEEGEFVISRSRRGTCLHLSQGCWRARGRRFLAWEDVPPGVPRPEGWSSYCRDCWPKGLAGSTSADSSWSGSSSS